MANRGGEGAPVPGRAKGQRRLIWFTGLLVAVLASWNNLVVARLPDYPGSYVVANVAAAGLLLAAARWIGLTWGELGLDWRRVPAGLRWGGVSFAVVAAGYALVIAIPALRPLLTDARAGGLDGQEIAYRILVHVPLGNVLWEELAFRGVLLAAFSRLLSLRAAIAASCAVFGIWHIGPTVNGLAANDLVNGTLLTTAAVLAVCLTTAAAGVILTWLRLRSGSLVAPALLHMATNSLGMLAAAIALQLD